MVYICNNKKRKKEKTHTTKEKELPSKGRNLQTPACGKSGAT